MAQPKAQRLVQSDGVGVARGGVREGALVSGTDAGGHRQYQAGGHALPTEGRVDVDRTDLRSWSGSRLAAVNWTRSPSESWSGRPSRTGPRRRPPPWAVLLAPHRSETPDEAALPGDYRKILTIVRTADGPVQAKGNALGNEEQHWSFSEVLINVHEPRHESVGQRGWHGLLIGSRALYASAAAVWGHVGRAAQGGAGGDRGSAAHRPAAGGAA